MNTHFTSKGALYKQEEEIFTRFTMHPAPEPIIRYGNCLVSSSKVCKATQRSEYHSHVTCMETLFQMIQEEIVPKQATIDLIRNLARINHCSVCFNANKCLINPLLTSHHSNASQM